MLVQMVMVRLFSLGLAMAIMSAGLPSFAYTLPGTIVTLPALFGGQTGNAPVPPLFGVTLRSALGMH